MNPLFPDHLYDNWKAVYALPINDPNKAQHMRLVRSMTRGNLHWLIRRLIGGIPSDGDDFIAKAIADGEMNPPDEFTRRRREDLKRKNQQHS